MFNFFIRRVGKVLFKKKKENKRALDEGQEVEPRGCNELHLSQTS